MKQYHLAEIFYSLQGEGMRAGSPNVFVRFAGCNLQCSVAKEGFDCDTDFSKRFSYSASEVREEMEKLAPPACRWCVLTGGEPSLQADTNFLVELKHYGWYIAVETNGAKMLPPGLVDWICLSPKTSLWEVEHRFCHELKMVRSYGQPLPTTIPIDLVARNYLVSPAMSVPKDEKTDYDNLQWCIQLVKANPDWRLSVQQHKGWKVR